MRVTVNRFGHLGIESPKGIGLVGGEGVALCTGLPEATAIDFDSEYPALSIRGFTAPVISQPKPGVFPVTITRRTTHGHLKLTSLFSMPDAAEKDVAITMTLKNVGTTPATNLELFRSMNITGSSGVGPPEWAAATADSAIYWHNEPAHGVVQTARTLAVPHEGGIVSDIDIPDECGSYYDSVPNEYDGGGYARVDYSLGTLAPGASITVVVTYQRF